MPNFEPERKYKQKTTQNTNQLKAHTPYLIQKKKQIDKRNIQIVCAYIPAGQHRLEHVDDQGVDGDNALQQLTWTLTSTIHQVWKLINLN